jgi:replicative DNA helicase
MGSTHNVLLRAGDLGQRIIENIRDSKQWPGLKTEIGDLDQFLMGFRPGDLVLLSGDRYAGKTALALSIARELAIKSDIGVLIFSPAKSAEYITSRLLLSESGCGMHGDIRLTSKDAPYLDKLVEAQQRLATAPITVYDQSKMGLDEIRGFSEGLKEEIGLVLVDDIDEVVCEDNVNITESLKRLADQLSLPILAISQLDHGTSESESHRPALCNISTSKTAHADSVLLTYCPIEAPDGTDLDGIMEVIIAQNRHSGEASVHLNFDSSTLECKSLA